LKVASFSFFQGLFFFSDKRRFRAKRPHRRTLDNGWTLTVFFFFPFFDLSGSRVLFFIYTFFILSLFWCPNFLTLFIVTDLSCTTPVLHAFPFAVLPVPVFFSSPFYFSPFLVTLLNPTPVPPAPFLPQETGIRFLTVFTSRFRLQRGVLLITPPFFFRRFSDSWPVLPLFQACASLGKLPPHWTF